MKGSLHLKGLNGIRTIAALSVVISHTMLGLDFFGLKRIQSGWNFATYGVTMFFTLSGFLITYLLIKEKEKFSTISIKKFYIRRVLRIWPLYYFYLALVLIVLFIYFPAKLPGTIAYYVFLAANIPSVLDISLPLLTHYWSLGVEEQFYLIWPWLFKKFSPLKAVITFIVVFLSIKFILRFLAPHGIAYQFIHVTRFDCMAIGALGAILYNYNDKRFSRFCFNILTQATSWIVLGLAAVDWLKTPDFINHDVLSLATIIIIINVAFNSKTNDFLLIVQQDGVQGMTLDQIRDYIISKGFDNAISFDGSTSATLMSNNTVKVSPSERKNNSIPTGATFVGTSKPTPPKPAKKKKSAQFRSPQ